MLYFFGKHKKHEKIIPLHVYSKQLELSAFLTAQNVWVFALLP